MNFGRLPPLQTAERIAAYAGRRDERRGCVMKRFIWQILKAVVMTAGIITIGRGIAGAYRMLAEEDGLPEDDGHFCFGSAGDGGLDETWEYDECDVT